jgi:DNA-binding winged helix-turn-helix (wHTH) protein
VRVSGQPFEVLVMLLERPGEVVTRDEIRQRLWPEGTFVDFDHSLNAAVAKLRDALQDSAASPRFIETIAKRGYRFIAPVESDPDNLARAVPGASSPRQAEQAQAAGKPPEAMEDRFSSLLTRPEEVPENASTARMMFLAAQAMYLAFYIAALANPGKIADLLLEATGSHLPAALMIATAAAGVPVRLYLISAVLLRSAGMRRRFLSKLFPAVFVLDLLWAASPFLVAPAIGTGLALGATAALAYLPFAQRTLVLMGALGNSEPNAS